jgi:2-dehydropantoate 2-reductase
VQIAILGPGGVGGFLAAALAHAGKRVVVVGRGETVRLIARDGIAVDSVLLGDFVGHPAAVETLDEAVDALIVATKATGLHDALDRIAAEPGLVVPLLNGLEHMAPLRERFGDRVAAGTIRIEADRAQQGRVVHTSRFLRVDMAADDPRPRPAIEALAQDLRDARIPVELADSETQVLWSKLVRLNSLATLTSAHDAPIGRIRSDPELRAELEAVVRETVAVAVAEGARLEPERVIAELDATHPTLGSSMWRDIAAGRPSELDAIPGAVLRAADRHGLACPTLERLVLAISERAGVDAPRR